MADDDLEIVPEIFESLPFMQSFPFEEYNMLLLNSSDKADPEMEINPIIISTFGKMESNARVHFNYLDSDSTLTIGFYLDDLKYIEDNHKLIKKLDSVRVDFENGLASKDINTKIKTIRKTKLFVKKLKSSILDSPAFERVLLDICEIKEISLSTDVLLDLHKLNPNGILKSGEFTKMEKETIETYLDFQLHYARIILGIVIAAKIY